MSETNWKAKRAQIVALRKKNFTFREIAKSLNVSCGCAFKACKQLVENKTYSDLKRSGRPRVTTQREDRKIERISLDNRPLTATEIRKRVSNFEYYYKQKIIVSI